MQEKEDRKTKRKVDLVSSHDNDEDNDGPSLLCDDEPEGLSEPHYSTGLGGPTLPFRPLRAGENLLYYEETIPDVDRNEYS